MWSQLPPTALNTRVCVCVCVSVLSLCLLVDTQATLCSSVFVAEGFAHCLWGGGTVENRLSVVGTAVSDSSLIRRNNVFQLLFP